MPITLCFSREVFIKLRQFLAVILVCRAVVRMAIHLQCLTLQRYFAK